MESECSRSCARLNFLERFVGELLREDAAQLFAIAFAGKVARPGSVFEAHNFHSLGLEAAESLDGQSQPVLGIVGDGDDPAGDVAVFRPQVKQRLFRIPRTSQDSGEAEVTRPPFSRISTVPETRMS